VEVDVRMTGGDEPDGTPADAMPGEPDRPAVVILITDDGAGFAPAMLPVTFERFKRGDPARGRATGGVGLGLAITADIVRSWGGSISAGNVAPDGDEHATGAWVRVVLPAAEPADAHVSLIK
jgi:signal transduction histidine kinase